MAKKKLTGLILALALLFTTAGCANASANTESPSGALSQNSDASSAVDAVIQPSDTAASAAEQPQAAEIDANQTLIVYYSYSGKTKAVAELLAENTGGDLYEIQVVDPYPEDMYETSDRAEQERETGNLPELSGTLPDLSAYSTILVGGPVWTSTLPPALMQYLAQTDFEGKQVMPFWTYDGNEGNYAEDFTAQARNATLGEGLGLSYPDRYEEADLHRELDGWLQTVGLLSGAAEIASNNAITITVGDTVINAELNDSAAAQEFKATLPVTVSMTRMGEHEYWGALAAPLTHADASELQTGYTVGDLAFWTPGDLFAVYFDEPEEAPEGLMILGSVTTDLSVFDGLGGNVEMVIESVAQWKGSKLK